MWSDPMSTQSVFAQLGATDTKLTFFKDRHPAWPIESDGAQNGYLS
jgi:hypothetical protein